MRIIDWSSDVCSSDLEPEWSARRTPRTGVNQERSSGHLAGLRQIHQVEQRRRDIGKPAVLQRLHTLCIAREDDRDKVARMGGMRLARFRVAQLLDIR